MRVIEARIAAFQSPRRDAAEGGSRGRQSGVRASVAERGSIRPGMEPQDCGEKSRRGMIRDWTVRWIRENILTGCAYGLSTIGKVDRILGLLLKGTVDR